MSEPDPDLKSWVEALIDQRIAPHDAQQLTERLRHDPAARKYCAEVLRFDAAMQDELLPQEIEWTDTRRVTLRNGNDGPGLEVQRNQTVRFGKSESTNLSTDLVSQPSSRSQWWLGGLIIAIALASGLVYWANRKQTHVAQIPALVLLNPDFEATDLTFLSEPTNRALVDWQDYFVTENADVAEISRVSGGKVLPKSGRNVARLSNFAYLTQRLRRTDGSSLLAKPNSGVTVSGWAYVMIDPASSNKEDGSDENTAEPFGLRGALRFVAGGSPGMVQYEATSETLKLTQGDWQRFTIKLTLPENLLLPASHGVARTNLDLTGKELTLSLDSLCKHGYHLLLDDLEITEAR